MRILHVGSLYPPGVVGGAEKVAAMLAEGQAARGYAVAAAHLVREDAGVHRLNGVEVTSLRSRNLLWIEDVQTRPRALTMANKLTQTVNLLAVRDFAEVFDRLRPHVVHTHSMVELPPLLWPAARRAGAAVVHTLHDYDLLCTRATLFKDGAPCAALHPSCRAMKAWKGVFARGLDAVAAVSQPVLDAHLAHGLFADLPAARRPVIWNGVEVARAADRSGREGPFTFGFLGRLVPEKGLSVLLEACRRLASVPGWRLRIAGRAPVGLEAFEAQAQGLPVEFLGFAEPRAFLRSVDVLAAPSIWAEPFGLTVVEAFAAGVPVIGSDRGAIGELVGRVDPDWVVAADDPAALAERMARALAAGRAALPSPECFAPVLDAASPGRMIDAYLALYAEASRNRAGAARRPRAAPAEPVHAHPSP